MGFLIGVDEAGYGPNLGPLCITATLWETPGLPSECDPWTLLAERVTREPSRGDDRLHIGDSKQVYSTARGIGALERSVLATLRMIQLAPKCFGELFTALAAAAPPEPATDELEPWFTGAHLPVPVEETMDRIQADGETFLQRCEACGFRLVAIRSDVVFTPRFNRLAAFWGNKSNMLSELTLQVVRQLWDPDAAQPVLVVADKHGGRNRYRDLLLGISDGRMVVTRQESREISRYQVGSTEFRFQARSEEHFPTALASMVSKYLREIAMRQFNAWWAARCPSVRPTQGYPEDARRFRQEVAAELARQAIPESLFWRCR